LKWLGRRVTPKAVLREREVYRRLKPAAGKIYLRLKVLDTLRLGFENRRPVPPGARSFMFVCHGNIMRSPMAAALFQQELARLGISGVTVDSAGLHARAGSGAHPRAQTAARELGIALDDHRSQTLTQEMVQQSAVILAMDFQNKAELLDLYPAARDKIVLLGAYGEGGMRHCEIADPFEADLEGTRACYRSLETCIRNVAADVFQRASRTSSARSVVVS
jgi:protein-tyrosine-phosphatase